MPGLRSLPEAVDLYGELQPGLPIWDMFGLPASGYDSANHRFTETYSIRENRVMSEKQDLIKEMMEMQKKFIAYEEANGVEMQDYFTPAGGHELDGYRQKYMELANKVVDLAHAEKGSAR